MTFVPAFLSSCQLATELPPMVAELLSLRSKLERPCSEATLTDLIVACLLKLASTKVSVIVPYEPATGADLDLLIVEPGLRSAVQFRMQAKKLTWHQKDWTISSYRELAHPSGTGQQARLLLNSSAHELVPTIPLYAFYNPEEVCTSSGGIIDGIALADGYAVAHAIGELISAKPKRPPFKRVGHLLPLFFPLSKILCPPDASASGRVPLPREAELAARTQLEQSRQRYRGYREQPTISRIRADQPAALPSSEEAPLRRLPRDIVVSKVVEEALKRSEGGGVVKARVKRTKVVLRAT